MTKVRLWSVRSYVKVMVRIASFLTKVANLSSFYPTDGHRAKFDMQQCPYFQICQELQCMELAPTFCETDDICYGNMHPRLIWNRTKTLARGGDCCDFDLYVKK